MYKNNDKDIVCDILLIILHIYIYIVYKIYTYLIKTFDDTSQR